jgi:hypothetical protein
VQRDWTRYPCFGVSNGGPSSHPQSTGNSSVHPSQFWNSFFHTPLMRFVPLWFWYATLVLGALATPHYQIAQSCCPGCSYDSSCCCTPPKTVTVVKTKTVPKLAKTTVKTQQKRLLERQTIPHHLCPTCPNGAVLLKSPKPGVKYCCAAKRQTVTTTRYVTKTNAVFTTYKPSSSLKSSSSSVKTSSAKSSSSVRASSTLRSSTTSTEVLAAALPPVKARAAPHLQVKARAAPHRQQAQ